MERSIKVQVCSQCRGKGIVSHGKICENCRGTGFLGTDGTYEYYLVGDGQGNLRVTDIKPLVSSSRQLPSQNKSVEVQKRTIVRGLSLITGIILYSSFLWGYFTFIKDSKVFWVVTILIVGFIIIYFLYDIRLVRKMLRFFTEEIFKGPDDFLSAVASRRRK